MTCLSALRELLAAFHLLEAQITMIEHQVGQNWREMYPFTRERIAHMGKGLEQHSPIGEWSLTGYDVIAETFDPSRLLSSEHNVISVVSRILLPDGEHVHLPFMNLHPERGIDLAELAELISIVTSRMPGYLLASGRYHHFYGWGLLRQEAWLKFMAQFLMPTVLVSQRYIGHSLYRGYTAVRLTPSAPWKPTLPFICGWIEPARTLIDRRRSELSQP